MGRVNPSLLFIAPPILRRSQTDQSWNWSLPLEVLSARKLFGRSPLYCGEIRRCSAAFRSTVAAFRSTVAAFRSTVAAFRSTAAAFRSTAAAFRFIAVFGHFSAAEALIGLS